MNARKYMERTGHSVRRFACYIALAGLGGALLGLAGEAMDWSYGVSFVTSVVVGTAISMAALREDPREWIRWAREEWRTSRRPSA